MNTCDYRMLNWKVMQGHIKCGNPAPFRGGYFHYCSMHKPSQSAALGSHNSKGENDVR